MKRRLSVGGGRTVRASRGYQVLPDGLRHWPSSCGMFNSIFVVFRGDRRLLFALYCKIIYL